MESMPKITPPPRPLDENPGARVEIGSGADEFHEVPPGGIAPFNPRVIAVVIDSLVASGIVWGLMMILPDFADKLAVLVGVAYIITRDSLPFLGGQGVGKKAMGLQAVMADGTSLVGKWEAAVVRNGVLCIPFFAIVELFVLLSREDKPDRGRRLGDEWARTKVILAPKPLAEEDPAP